MPERDVMTIGCRGCGALGGEACRLSPEAAWAPLGGVCDRQAAQAMQRDAPAAFGVAVTPCPYAMENAIYQTCPRDAHGLEGARCEGCPATPAGPDADVATVRRALRLLTVTPGRDGEAAVDRIAQRLERAEGTVRAVYPDHPRREAARLETPDWAERARLAGERWFREHPDGAWSEDEWRDFHRSVLEATVAGIREEHAAAARSLLEAGWPEEDAPAGARHRLPVNARARLANVERLLSEGLDRAEFSGSVDAHVVGEALVEVRSMIDETAADA